MFLSSTVLVISNLIPLFGTLFYEWNAPQIIIAYWVENLVIGYFTMLKIPLSEGLTVANITLNDIHVSKIPKEKITTFFIMHYSIFCLAHGIMIYAFFLKEVSFNQIGLSSVLLMTTSIFISHLISYRTNFIEKREYLNISPSQQMIKPYSRIMIMHLVVILAGNIAENSGYALMSVVMLILLKTAVDLGSHILEHKNGQV